MESKHKMFIRASRVCANACPNHFSCSGRQITFQDGAQSRLFGFGDLRAVFIGERDVPFAHMGRSLDTRSTYVRQSISKSSLRLEEEHGHPLRLNETFFPRFKPHQRLPRETHHLAQVRYYVADP